MTPKTLLVGASCLMLASCGSFSKKKPAASPPVVASSSTRTHVHRIDDPAPPVNSITVYGQVARQGRYELDAKHPLTLTGAIKRAGGFSQFAKTRAVKLVRKTQPRGNETLIFDLRKMMRGEKPPKDPELKPGDVIIIDEKIVIF